MNLKFDNATIRKWKDSQTGVVKVSFVSGGCAGTKLDVSPSHTDLTDSATGETNVDGIRVLFEEKDRVLLENARITGMEKNGRTVWIYTAWKVKGRCGCGSSFSFTEEGRLHSKHEKAPSIPGADMEKLKILKTAFAKKS